MRDGDLAWCRPIKADPETKDISILLTIDDQLADGTSSGRRTRARS
jgi:hypothetical protein